MAVCHLPLETILSLPPAISRPRSPHPHSPCLPRSLPRTLAAHLGLRSAVGPATTTAAVQIDPSVAFECTSQSPGKGCCDERLNPPVLRHVIGRIRARWPAVEIVVLSLRSLAARNSFWREAQFDTIRLCLIKVAGRVTEMVTRIKIALPTAYPYQAGFAMLTGQITKLPP